MLKSNAIQLSKVGEKYTGRGDFNELKNYLIPIADSALTQDPQLIEQIQKHLQKANSVIKREHANVLQQIEALNELYNHDINEDYNIPERNTLNWYDIIILRYTIKEIEHYNPSAIKNRLALLETQRNLMEGMMDLTQYLIDTQKNFAVRMQRIVQPRDRSLFLLDYEENCRASLLRRFANKLYTKVQILPPPFRSNTANREWLNKILDKIQCKPETTYFSELPEEIDILDYFLSPKSPFLHEEGFDNPYDRENSPEAVKEWVDLATVVLAEYVQTEDQDRASLIAIIALRYLFTQTYPRFYPPRSHDIDHLNKVMQRFRNKTPKELNLVLKYIPQALQEEPTERLFSTDANAQQAVSFMREAELLLTPIDSAYCVVKAHECLSRMCVVNEFKNKGKETWTNDEFLEKLPGFDDIFDIWRAFLSNCYLADPKQLLSFIMDFSKLPGFTARILASLAYFEGAVNQLEAEPDE